MNTEKTPIEILLDEYEATLSWKRGGSTEDRLRHVLSQYRSLADTAIFKIKDFADDVKTMFKALELITEGMSSDGLNHGQKRVIANHQITMIRSMVDKLVRIKDSYVEDVFDRYDFFRSETPERGLLQQKRDLSETVKWQEKLLAQLKEKHPDIFKDDEIPF